MKKARASEDGGPDSGWLGSAASSREPGHREGSEGDKDRADRTEEPETEKRNVPEYGADPPRAEAAIVRHKLARVLVLDPGGGSLGSRQLLPEGEDGADAPGERRNRAPADLTGHVRTDAVPDEHGNHRARVEHADLGPQERVLVQEHTGIGEKLADILHDGHSLSEQMLCEGTGVAPGKNRNRTCHPSTRWRFCQLG